MRRSSLRLASRKHKQSRPGRGPSSPPSTRVRSRDHCRGGPNRKKLSPSRALVKGEKEQRGTDNDDDEEGKSEDEDSGDGGDEWSPSKRSIHDTKRNIGQQQQPHRKLKRKRKRHQQKEAESNMGSSRLSSCQGEEVKLISNQTSPRSRQRRRQTLEGRNVTAVASTVAAKFSDKDAGTLLAGSSTGIGHGKIGAVSSGTGGGSRGASKGILFSVSGRRLASTSRACGTFEKTAMASGGDSTSFRSARRHGEQRGSTEGGGKRHSCREFTCQRKAHYGTPGWVPAHCIEHRRDWEVFLKVREGAPRFCVLKQYEVRGRCFCIFAVFFSYRLFYLRQRRI